MGICINNNDILDCIINGKRVLSLRINDEIIWPDEDKEIISCFGKGYWVDDYPWTDDIPWVD